MLKVIDTEPNNEDLTTWQKITLFFVTIGNVFVPMIAGLTSWLFLVEWFIANIFVWLFANWVELAAIVAGGNQAYILWEKITTEFSTQEITWSLVVLVIILALVVYRVWENVKKTIRADHDINRERHEKTIETNNTSSIE